MEASIIDLSAFETLKAMTGADYLPVLIEAYFEDSAGLFVEMRESLQDGDSQRFSRAAHSLKGNSANFGATHLTDLSRELEFLGKSGSLEQAGPRLEALADEYARVKLALEGLRDGI